MSRIRSTNTTPELLVRKHLFAHGFRYTLHDKKLPGRPDIVLPKYRAVILVHGCFWHGHKNCRYYAIPETRRAYWVNKIQYNNARDLAAENALREQGWLVIKVWECDLKTSKRDRTLGKVVTKLRGRLSG